MLLSESAVDRMDADNLHPALRTFVHDVSQILLTETSEELFLPRVGELMRVLVSHDNWLEPACARSHPSFYQQYLLYADPDDRLSVVSFVWGPGQSTPIHDHTVWGVIGMLRGSEYAQQYDVGVVGRPNPIGQVLRLMPGDVEYVSPRLGDVHQVRNAYSDRVSISIHAYGGNIGKIKRHIFAADTGSVKDFISGYATPVN